MSESRTRVFWDVVDFPFPNGLAPEKIYQNMKLVLKKFGYGSGDLSISAYVDSETSLVPWDKSTYDKAGITIITHQRDRDRFMLLDIALWEMDMRYEACKPNMLAISEKIKKESLFLNFLEAMYRCCNVLGVAAPHDPSSIIKSIVFVGDFTSLSKSLLGGVQLQPINDQRRQENPKRIKLDEEEEPSPLDSMKLEQQPHFSRYHMKQLLGFDGDQFSAMAAYVDDDTEITLEEEYKKAGIIFIPRRTHTMSVDIVLWAMENPATFSQPIALVVFSDNVKQGTDLYNALEGLHYRNYYVFVFNILDGPPVFYWPSINDHRPRIISKNGSIIGLPCLYNHNYISNRWPIHVFLDVHGCSTELTAILSSAILSGLRNKGYRGKVLFRPYLDDMDVRCGHRDGYTCLPSIKVVTGDDDKSAIVTRMLLDILFWGMNYDDQPLNVLLITNVKDTKSCDFVMQALERRGFNVIFKPLSHRIHSFESFCKSPTDHKKLKPCPKLTDRIKIQLASLDFHIYWLVDECPSNSRPGEFRYYFRSTMIEKGYLGCELVNLYVDKRMFSDDLIKHYGNSGLGVRCIPEGIPEDVEMDKITLMSLDMARMMRHGRFNFLVISKPFKDALFDSVVRVLKERGCSVLFETVDYMLTFGSSLWSAKGILDGSCRHSLFFKSLTTSHV